jgi:hypothetical protein
MFLGHGCLPAFVSVEATMHTCPPTVQSHIDSVTFSHYVRACRFGFPGEDIRDGLTPIPSCATQNVGTNDVVIFSQQNIGFSFLFGYCCHYIWGPIPLGFLRPQNFKDLMPPMDGWDLDNRRYYNKQLGCLSFAVRGQDRSSSLTPCSCLPRLHANERRNAFLNWFDNGFVPSRAPWSS